MGIGASVKKGFSIAFRSLPLVLLLLLISISFNLITRPLTSKVQPVIQKIQQSQAPDFTELTPMLPSLLLVILGSILLNIFTDSGSFIIIRDTIKQSKGSISSFLSVGAKFYLRFILLFL